MGRPQATTENKWIVMSEWAIKEAFVALSYYAKHDPGGLASNALSKFPKPPEPSERTNHGKEES